jgi:hypothetical protein
MRFLGRVVKITEITDAKYRRVFIRLHGSLAQINFEDPASEFREGQGVHITIQPSPFEKSSAS